MEKVTVEQIEQLEEEVKAIGDKMQAHRDRLFYMIDEMCSKDMNDSEKIEAINEIQKVYSVIKNYKETKNKLRKDRKSLSKQFLIQNDEFLSRVNAVHKKTGELLVVEESTENHCKVKRSNHILNTLKKCDVEMLGK